MTIGRYVAGLLRELADKLEPPAPLMERADAAARAASRARHPSTAEPAELAVVVPFPDREGDDDL